LGSTSVFVKRGIAGTCFIELIADESVANDERWLRHFLGGGHCGGSFLVGVGCLGVDLASVDASLADNERNRRRIYFRSEVKAGPRFQSVDEVETIDRLVEVVALYDCESVLKDFVGDL
jgi:hypothetical protein